MFFNQTRGILIVSKPIKVMIVVTIVVLFKKVRSKTFLVKKNVCQKNLGQNILVPTKNFCPKAFGFKKI